VVILGHEDIQHSSWLFYFGGVSVDKLREIKFFQEGQSSREDGKKSGEALRLKPERIWKEGNGTPRWIDEREVSEIIGVAVQTLRNWRFQRIGIPYSKVGKGRMVRYRLDEVIQFMEERKIHFEN
jgi:hypothetical protein